MVARGEEAWGWQIRQRVRESMEFLSHGNKKHNIRNTVGDTVTVMEWDRG